MLFHLNRNKEDLIRRSYLFCFVFNGRAEESIFLHFFVCKYAASKLNAFPIISNLHASHAVHQIIIKKLEGFKNYKQKTKCVQKSV